MNATSWEKKFSPRRRREVHPTMVGGNEALNEFRRNADLATERLKARAAAKVKFIPRKKKS